MYGYGYGFPRQPTVAQLKSKAARAIAGARRRGEEWEPVNVVAKRPHLATSWWGRAWGDNLERYADFSNRLERGRRYVRSDAVLDLKISEGQVRAKVMGSGSTPYDVTIGISPLSPERAEALVSGCSSKVKDLDSLVKGEFPEDLKEVFYQRGGLFPEPGEISFDCSCPDWASMCKHVTAALYGIGVRFDQDPLLFFKLRGIDPEALIDTAVQNRVESMLENADRPSRRIMDDSSWQELFGL